MKIRLAIFCLIPFTCFGWDGYDYDGGVHIEIGVDNLVRTGNDIEIYDHGAGEYRDVEVLSIDRYGDSVEIRVYDDNNKMDWDEAVERMEEEGLEYYDDSAVEDYIEENSIYERTFNMDL